MTYRHSAAAFTQLQQSHTAINTMYVLHSGKPTARLSFVSGQVTVDADRPVLRNLTGTIIDPTGDLDGSDIDDLLSPYDCEVAPYRGVLLPNGKEELAPQGVFQLTNRQVGEFGAISISGQDRSIIYQGRMDSALAISGNTPVEVALGKLLTMRNRALSMHSWVTGFTCGPLLYPPDTDVWSAAQELAASVGGVLYHDRKGNLIFEQGVPTTHNPVRSYRYGGGVLLEAERAEDADTVKNVIVVRSSKADVAGTITVTVEDTDPTSRTFAGGRYGRRVKEFSSQHIGSIQQGKQVGAFELLRELGKSETGTLTLLVDPFLDHNEVILCHYPDKGFYERSMVTASMVVPLTVRDSMTVVTRKSIIGKDGRVLDDGTGKII